MPSKIEWLRSEDGRPGYSINPVRGLCPMGCSYCYARRMYLNPYYKAMYSHQEIAFNEDAITYLPCHPCRIFVGSTMELFGEWVKPEWLEKIFWRIRHVYPQHTFIFLTKRPENLMKWSPFPPNCYIGVSAVDKLHFYAACHYLADIKAIVKFISFEPLLESMAGAQPIGQHLYNGGVSWLIIGQQTPVSAKTTPQCEWLCEIVKAADKAHVPVFLKNNLSTMEFG